MRKFYKEIFYYKKRELFFCNSFFFFFQSDSTPKSTFPTTPSSCLHKRIRSEIPSEKFIIITKFSSNWGPNCEDANAAFKSSWFTNRPRQIDLFFCSKLMNVLANSSHWSLSWIDDFLLLARAWWGWTKGREVEARNIGITPSEGLLNYLLLNRRLCIRHWTKEESRNLLTSDLQCFAVVNLEIWRYR